MTSPDTEGRREVAKRLREELGWYAWANGIEHGAADAHLTELLRQLRQHRRQKHAYLLSHVFQPNTEGEGRHAAMTLWCERADSLIAELEATDAA
jgi:hypothetical protein